MANSTGPRPFRCPGHVRRLVWIGVLLAFAGSDAAAQPIRFGSADDPREQIQEVWWRRESHFYAMGGVSLIAAQWRGAGSVALDLVRRSVTAHLQGTVRAGVLGEYGADFDEPYDALRLIEFARYNPPRTHPVHLRVGLIDRMRLGTGHIVNFFSSSIAWDERTVGAEAIYQGDNVELAGFTDNVLLDGVTGGRFALRPLGWTASRPTQTLIVGFNYVRDLADYPQDVRRFEGYNVDAQLDLFQSGDVAFSPFASYARYPSFGDGFSLGADIHSDHFLDLLSFRFRLALYYNDEGFMPGFVNAFYPINNPLARILDSNANLSLPADEEALAGVPLEASDGNNDLLTELHLLINRNFELWYSFRRHFGAQRFSELHLRLFLRTAERLRLEVGIDRAGLKGFFTIFNDMDDLSALVFGTDYQIKGPLYLFLRARYSYERIETDDAYTQRFLVQRRFEPMTGFRFRF